MSTNKQALREKLEAWAEEAGALPLGHLKKQRTASGNYSVQIYTYMWKAWSACHEALLDELEAAQKSNEFLKEQLAQLASFNPDWDKLEAATDSIREHMVELIAARNRIAELEAREVVLPQRQEPTSSGHYGEGYLVPSNAGSALDYEETVEAIRAAGITVKGDSE